MGATGATPQDQLDALPLRTAASVTDADVVILAGTKLTAYWGPASCGVNAVNYAADPDDATLSLLLTNYLALTGFNQYSAVLVLTQTAGALDVGIAHSIVPQYRAGSAQPRSGVIGGTMYNQAAVRTPSYGALALPFSVPIAFGWANSNSGANPPLTMTPDCRLWFRRGAVPKAGQVYSVHLWAAQS